MSSQPRCLFGVNRADLPMSAGGLNYAPKTAHERTWRHLVFGSAAHRDGSLLYWPLTQPEIDHLAPGHARCQQVVERGLEFVEADAARDLLKMLRAQIGGEALPEPRHRGVRVV